MADVEEKVAEIDEAGFTHAEEVIADGLESADPVLPEPDTSKELKEEEEEAGEKECGPVHDLKSTLLISGAVVAVVGAIFAILKKIKEA